MYWSPRAHTNRVIILLIKTMLGNARNALFPHDTAQATVESVCLSFIRKYSGFIDLPTI